MTASARLTSIDVNVTARCNLRCTFCWGPDHEIRDALSATEWEKALAFFRAQGVSRVVFTGGEPLLRKDLPRILEYANKIRYRITLSTNGLLLRRRMDDVLPWVHEVGLPLDGSTEERNASMRPGPGSALAFGAAVEAANLVANEYPGIELTLRTVVSRVNISDVADIGRVVDGLPGRPRWKLYQFVPASIGSAHRAEHEVTAEKFGAVFDDVRLRFPHLNMKSQSAVARVGRYLFVGPEGRLFIPGGPTGYIDVGTWAGLRASGDLDTLLLLPDPEKNVQHGSPGADLGQLDRAGVRGKGDGPWN